MDGRVGEGEEEEQRLELESWSSYRDERRSEYSSSFVFNGER